MRGTKQFELKLVGVVLAMALGSCNPTSLDNGSSADAVLEVFTIPQIPPITAALDGTTTPPTCTFTVTNMTVSLRNQPKNAVAGTSPFNDIVLDTVDMIYEWDNTPNPVAPTPQRTMVIGGTIPAGGSGSVSFPPFMLGDLLLGSYGGHSANITMIFHGHTVAGEAVTSPARGAVVSVNACGASTSCPPGADFDSDGLCDPNDACPGCNSFNCQATGTNACNVTACTNASASCSGAFDPPTCILGTDSDGDGITCPNDLCPTCGDTACTGANPGSSHPCSSIPAATCAVCP